jgi:hypothetical protein
VEKIRLDSHAWQYMLNKIHDIQSASMAFDILNYMLQETLGKTPALQPYCRSIFKKE